MAKNPVVTFQMKDGGVIKAELYPEIAPNTVNNFISLVNHNFYDGLIFHRVIRGFMIPVSYTHLDVYKRQVDGREVQVVSREKVSQPIRLRCLKALEGIVLETPVIKGEMVLCDAADTGVDIVAAENLF